MRGIRFIYLILGTVLKAQPVPQKVWVGRVDEMSVVPIQHYGQYHL